MRSNRRLAKCSLLAGTRHGRCKGSLPDVGGCGVLLEFASIMTQSIGNLPQRVSLFVEVEPLKPMSRRIDAKSDLAKLVRLANLPRPSDCAVAEFWLAKACWNVDR